MKQFISVILTFFVTVQLFGQTNERYELSGTVISGVNHLPLYNSLVMVQTMNNYGVGTDSLGHFRIKGIRPGTHQFEIREFGYKLIDTTIVFTNSDIENIEFVMDAFCKFNKETAKQHLNKNKPKLLLSGGIAPVIYHSDKKFERKFKVGYYDFGCMPEAQECMTEYNQIIFEYLDSKYGNKWREMVRSDVIGLNN